MHFQLNNLKEKKFYFEKNYTLIKITKLKKFLKKPQKLTSKILKSYKTLKKLNFIELPKFGFQELKKIIKKFLIKRMYLMIDYGYLKSNNQNTLQSVMKHKKNNLLDNLGKADITAHVNFDLLNEFFLKNGLKS